MTQTKILHISDLHICTEELVPKLTTLADNAKNAFGQEIDIEFASKDSINSLKAIVRNINPDVICITGDITTFGDHASFELAKEFIDSIKNRGQDSRTVIVTPGNHDVLCSQLKKIMDDITKNPLYYLGALFFRKKAKTIKMAREILNDSKLGINLDKPLSNFRNFCKESGCSNSGEIIRPDNNDPIMIVPFDSVSNDHLWVNIGKTDQNEFTTFKDELRKFNKENGTLIALLHHNPLSSPDVIEPKLVHAYNSMPGGATFVKEMQDIGVDLILYGHQHSNACCLVDYQPCTTGHLYLIAAPSATCGNKGYNLITVKSKYHACKESYLINAAGSGELATKASTDLVLESEHVDDFITLSASKELRYYRYIKDENERNKWDEMFNSEAKELFLAGPRIRNLKKPYRRTAIIEFLKRNQESNVKVLITDPELFELTNGLEDEAKSRLSKIWGTSDNWQDQAKTVRDLIKSILEFQGELEAADISINRFKWRFSHTLMPIGAIARDLNQDNGSMLIRMLPVGVMGSMERPLISLESRHDSATYAYYKHYLEMLWEKGRKPTDNDYNFEVKS